MLDPVDVILTPVDPVRGLGAALSELSRLAELDPKLKAAQAEVGEYLQQLDQGDVSDIVGPVLWVWAREVLRSPQGLIQLHAAFNDGGATLQAVEETLHTTLRAEVLHELVAQARSSDDDSALAQALAQARAELSQAANQLDVTFASAASGAVTAAAILAIGLLAIAVLIVASS